MALTAARVNQLLALVGKIKRAPRPLVPPTDEELRQIDLQLDRTVLNPRWRSREGRSAQ